MDNLCIDLKHKKIHHEINQKLEPILKTNTGKFLVYMLNDETMEHFKKIIKKKCNEKENESKSIQTMIEHKFSKSNNEIKLNMKILNDELKSKLKLSNDEMNLNMKMLNEANARLETQNQELKELILKSFLKQDI